MLAIVNTPSEPEPVAIREVAEPELRPNEALVAVHAFSLNRGELRLFQVRPEGWRPGQDIAGVVVRAAADGLPVAGLTALRALRHGAPLLGKRVLITGAAGGVGNLAVQLAARSGARVTAVAGRPERAG